MANNTGYKYEKFTYNPYKESTAVVNAGNKKTQAENALANYGDFAFSKQGDYDSIYSQYKNRDPFSYDFNADALYQQYKDKYIQQGKMAMADTIGQASAMTGGYGNSYAATVGNQAYQASLANLNDVIPELYQMAYSRYNQEGQDMLNMLGLLGDERAFEYGKWGDGYNRLASDRDYYGTQYNNERTWDYNKYDSDRTLAQGEHTNDQGYKYQNYRDAIADEQWEKNYQLSQRELEMKEEAWNLEKAAYNKVNDGGDDDKPATVTPKETAKTTSFINSHMESYEFMNRGTSKTPDFRGSVGRSYDEYVTYIKAEIDKVWDKLSDEERAYLIQYYKL